MNEILDFFREHWRLSAGFVALLIAYILFELKFSGNKKEISADHAIALYNNQQATVLDIRASDDFGTGHIVGSMQVEISETDDQFKKLQKYAQKPIVVVSADGKQALKFVQRLESHGFVQVFSLAGGIHAWQAAGLPLVKKG